MTQHTLIVSAEHGDVADALSRIAGHVAAGRISGEDPPWALVSDTTHPALAALAQTVDSAVYKRISNELIRGGAYWQEDVTSGVWLFVVGGTVRGRVDTRGDTPLVAIVDSWMAAV